MKKKKSTSLLALVALLGLGVGYWHFSGLAPQALAPEADSVTDTPEMAAQTPTPMQAPASSQTPTATSPTAAPIGTPDTAAPQAASAEPKIELLRVEPNGSMVMAGLAQPDRRVILTNGQTIVAEDRSGPGGDFVFSPVEALPSGSYRLRLHVEDANGEMVASEQSALVNVPERGREGDLMVMLEEPGTASRLLVTPKAPPVAEEAVEQAALPQAPAAPEETASLDAPLRGPAEFEPAGDAEAAAPLPAEAEAEPAVQVSEDVSPVPLGPPPGDLAIAAVEIEREQLYVAGRAEPGSTVQLYLDDAPVARVENTTTDEFLASAEVNVEPGRRVVRADSIGRDGSVVARVEVPFERPEGERMAALAPRTPPQPAEASGEPKAVPADGAEAAMQPELEPVEGRVLIRRGDTLWRISREAYGQGRRYTVIYLANGDQIRDPNLIYPGQVFRMPEMSDREG